MIQFLINPYSCTARKLFVLTNPENSSKQCATRSADMEMFGSLTLLTLSERRITLVTRARKVRTLLVTRMTIIVIHKPPVAKISDTSIFRLNLSCYLHVHISSKINIRTDCLDWEHPFE
jgi:hypothetical protein